MGIDFVFPRPDEESARRRELASPVVDSIFPSDQSLAELIRRLARQRDDVFRNAARPSDDRRLRAPGLSQATDGRGNRSRAGDWLIFPPIRRLTSDHSWSAAAQSTGKNVPVPLAAPERLHGRELRHSALPDSTAKTMRPAFARTLAPRATPVVPGVGESPANSRSYDVEAPLASRSLPESGHRHPRRSGPSIPQSVGSDVELGAARRQDVIDPHEPWLLSMLSQVRQLAAAAGNTAVATDAHRRNLLNDVAKARLVDEWRTSPGALSTVIERARAANDVLLAGADSETRGDRGYSRTPAVALPLRAIVPSAAPGELHTPARAASRTSHEWASANRVPRPDLCAMPPHSPCLPAHVGQQHVDVAVRARQMIEIRLDLDAQRQAREITDRIERILKDFATAQAKAVEAELRQARQRQFEQGVSRLAAVLE